MFSLIIIAISCGKEHLPQYYFRCKVDSKEYIPDNCANCISKKILGDTVLIIGGNKGFETLGIGINDNNGIKVGTYELNEVIGRRGDYKFSTTPNDRYFTNATHKGKLTISTLDRVNKIMAGTFYYEAHNIITDKKVSVTEGKFKLKFDTN